MPDDRLPDDRLPDDRLPDDRLPDGDAAAVHLADPIGRAASLLRTTVPMRAAWRDALLDDIRRAAASASTPAPQGGSHVGAVPLPSHRSARRALVLSWPVAVAASIALFAAGAAATTIALRSRTETGVAVTAERSSASPDAARPTQFVLVAPDAHRVALVGDFNLWDPATAPMHRVNGTGAWMIEMPLAAGRHVYAFVVDGDVTADPSAPRTAGDDFGRPNSVILVSPQS
jgi:hypothetical protein